MTNPRICILHTRPIIKREMSKQDFLNQFDQIAATLPLQGKARAIIHNGLDFPTTRDEYWKYTRTAPIISSIFNQNEHKINAVDRYLIEGLDAHLIVFVNGEYSKALSKADFPKGVKVLSLSEANAEDKSLMCEHLGMHANNEGQAFSTLNTSYFKDVAFLKVDDNIEVDKPLHVLSLSAGDKQAINMRNLVVLGTNSKANIITQFEGEANSESFTNVVTEVVVGAGSKGGLYIIQNEGETASHINSTQVSQARDSQFSVITVTKTGKLVRNNLNYAVNGEGCESNMYGVYFTRGNQHVDNHTYVDHLFPNCNSNELYKGVMTDKSTGVFNGKIMVRRDAQKTNAFQSNQNVLLTDTASIFTKPELEIYADDVKCSHGCTVGQLDEEATFYLQSRGLSKDDATKLLIQAFASDVIDKVEVEPLRYALEVFIHNQFAN